MTINLGEMPPIKPGALEKPSTSTESDAPPPRWAEHVARTTLALAVLAAVASGQNAGEFARTILAQGEESDAWAYYQAKSMKGLVEANQAEALSLMMQSDPKLAPAATPLVKAHQDWRLRYEQDANTRYTLAKAKQYDKEIHLARSSGLAHAFVALQAGVILCTLSSSRRKKGFWHLALFFGILGLLLALNAYLRWIPNI